MVRPFRFGVSIWSAGSGDEWALKARHAEALGYDVLSVPDHLAQGMFPPFVALGAAAAATARLRVGTLVLNNDLRHPALVAREVACLDLLSGGRVELGLGAGHMESELASLGMPFDPAPRRIARLEEALDVMQRLLAGETLTCSGEHYTLREHALFPRGLQQPLPMLVGGNGRAVLELAARKAAIIGFTGFFPGERGRSVSPVDFTAAGFARRLAIVRAAAGDRFERLELHALLQAVIASDDARSAAQALQPKIPGLSVEELLSSPFLLLGTREQMAQALIERRERFGLSYFTTFEPGMAALAQVIERLHGR
jgi:probable F420-dependent oxidoreductase